MNCYNHPAGNPLLMDAGMVQHFPPPTTKKHTLPNCHYHNFHTMTSLMDDDTYYSYFDGQNPAGKRQRKAAAALVSNFTGVGGKKSRAQPRPAVQIPPRGIGPIAEPNRNDVLCGRGGRINSHEGNVQFREFVHGTKKDYLAKTTKKLEKAHIAAKLVERIRTMDPPGRFLKEDSDTGMWWDIGDAKAIKKVGQALREDAPEIRPEIDNGTGEETKKSDDDGNDDEEADVKRTNSKDKGSSSPSSNRVIVLPTSRSGRRGEDDSPGALPPQAKSSASVSSGGSNGYQQVLPPQGSMPPPQSQRGVMYPPSSSSSASTLRHGQFSYGRNQGGAMSRQAMEMMNQQQMYNQAVMNNVLFGRPFHPPPSEMSFGSHGSSVSGMSGLTNSALMSGISDGVSSLTAGSGGARFSQGQMDQATYNNQMMHAAASNRLMNSMNPRPVGMFQHQNSGRSGSSVYSGSRGSNGGAGFNNYMTAGSDVSGQTMPQAAAVLGRTASHGDGSGAVKEDLSLAENSLRGGGIRGDASYQQQQYQQQFMQQQRPQQADDGSIASGHSGESRTRPCAPGFKDSMDYSVYSGTSIPSRSARGGPSYASRYGSTNASVSNRSYTSNYSIGAMSQSVADMSLQSGASVASFSAHSAAMSDFSDTLLALDLAESSRNS